LFSCLIFKQESNSGSRQAVAAIVISIGYVTNCDVFSDRYGVTVIGRIGLGANHRQVSISSEAV